MEPTVDDLKLQRDGQLSYGPKRPPIEWWPKRWVEVDENGERRLFEDWGDGGVIEY